jgi:hypothetical protein
MHGGTTFKAVIGRQVRNQLPIPTDQIIHYMWSGCFFPLERAISDYSGGVAILTLSGESWQHCSFYLHWGASAA